MHLTFKNIFRKEKTDFKSLVKKGAMILDVRTAAEFGGGHIKGALNVPVESIRTKTDELKKLKKPVITCCKTGMRSRMAASVLSSSGIEVYNGGAWDSLERKLS